MAQKGIVSAGHARTAEAAQLVLRDGGNAFDAIIAAAFAGCVAEPVLSSLGGGGFLIAHLANGPSRVYDFFVQTPSRRPPDAKALDFYPIVADFGTAQQEFHIGMGAIATPGVVKGVFEIHRDLGRMPMSEIVKPAVTMARDGIRITAFERYLFDVVEAIYASSETARQAYGSRTLPGKLVQEGELLRLPELADTFEALAREGETLFYRGDIAREILAECRTGGGCLTAEDLESYRVHRREPLEHRYRNARLLTNPPPSCGGLLIAFGLSLLSTLDLHAKGFGSSDHLHMLASVMDATNKARMDHLLAGRSAAALADALFEAEHLAAYQREVLQRCTSLRGTTHMCVIDATGNVASMTISNGEGCGHVTPGTGIMLNNMLGEQDLNPEGFHCWAPNQRMSSMMAPSLLFQPDGTVVATGSGGSNRIRTAVLQVLLNLVDFKMPLEDAVTSPRIHFEEGLLSVEGGFAEREVAALAREFDQHRLWPERNLFFGGAHSASYHPRGPVLQGAADPRRQGVSVMA